MGRKAIDLTGRRYERLVAIRRVKNENDIHHAFWECQCDCGNITNVSVLLSHSSQILIPRPPYK